MLRTGRSRHSTLTPRSTGRCGPGCGPERASQVLCDGKDTACEDLGLLRLEGVLDALDPGVVVVHLHGLHGGEEGPTLEIVARSGETVPHRRASKILPAFVVGGADRHVSTTQRVDP